MSALSIELNWHRSSTELIPGQYSNAHQVVFNEQYEIVADAAPDWGGHQANTNPEQALAAAISSCHMMTFLALSAKAGWPVRQYDDHATATLGKNPKGQMSVVRIDLKPRVSFDPGFQVEPAELEKMQQRAHRYCFVANSLAPEVEINIDCLGD
jgi:organic hydroperoxide reductase OsmC/OhrA